VFPTFSSRKSYGASGVSPVIPWKESWRIRCFRCLTPRCFRCLTPRCFLGLTPQVFPAFKLQVSGHDSFDGVN